jgi:hypothetical protein
MKEIKYTRHAKNRLRWRKITEAEIESAINQPDFFEPTLEGRLNAWLKLSDKYLRVTYREVSGKIMVISAVKKKKGWR